MFAMVEESSEVQLIPLCLCSVWKTSYSFKLQMWLEATTSSGCFPSPGIEALRLNMLPGLSPLASQWSWPHPEILPAPSQNTCQNKITFHFLLYGRLGLWLVGIRIPTTVTETDGLCSILGNKPVPLIGEPSTPSSSVQLCPFPGFLQAHTQ